MIAVMKETDYMKKPTFLKNAWAAFKEVRLKWLLCAAGTWLSMLWSIIRWWGSHVHIAIHQWSSCICRASSETWLTVQVLGKGHTIRGLEKCDFTPIYEHFMAKKEVEKARTKEVRLLFRSMSCKLTSGPHSSSNLKPMLLAAHCSTALKQPSTLSRASMTVCAMKCAACCVRKLVHHATSSR